MTGTFEEVDGVASKPSLPLVLILDDDSGMRALFEIYLGSSGFRVLLSQSGEEAMQMIAEHREICLVIMDVVMSGLSGLRLAEQVRATRPGIAILFCSGHTAKELSRFGLDHLQEEEFMQKPCTVSDLRRKVNGLLARPALQAVDPVTREEQGQPPVVPRPDYLELSPAKDSEV